MCKEAIYRMIWKLDNYCCEYWAIIIFIVTLIPAILIGIVYGMIFGAYYFAKEWSIRISTIVKLKKEMKAR